MSDLAALHTAAMHTVVAGADAVLRGEFVSSARGVALIDAALARNLKEWRRMRLCDAEILMEVHGRIARGALPKLGREARRRLGL